MPCETSGQVDMAVQMIFERHIPSLATLLIAFVVVQQPARAASTPAGDGWDVQPRSFESQPITPATPCALNYHGKDGTFVSYRLYPTRAFHWPKPNKLAANSPRPILGSIAQPPGVKFVVSRAGQKFFEGFYYNAELQNSVGTFTFQMSPRPDGSLVYFIMPDMDPKEMLIKLLQTGATLTISLANLPILLREEIPGSGARTMSQFQSCFDMVVNSQFIEIQSILRDRAKPKPSAP